MSKGFNLSLKVKYNKIVEVEQEVEESDVFLDISRLIIPFSVAFNTNHTPDIYDGEELIPFEKKDSLFKKLLIDEFLRESR